MVYVCRDMKCRGIYLALFTNPEGDSYFSIYQIKFIVFLVFVCMTASFIAQFSSSEISQNEMPSWLRSRLGRKSVNSLRGYAELR